MGVVAADELEGGAAVDAWAETERTDDRTSEVSYLPGCSIHPSHPSL